MRFPDPTIPETAVCARCHGDAPEGYEICGDCYDDLRQNAIYEEMERKPEPEGGWPTTDLF